MKDSRFTAIILAAGLATRMKQFKPLLPVGSQTITDRVISIFRENGIGISLVVGWQKEELLTGITAKDVRIVFNPDYQQGMFTSVQAGLNSLESDCQAFFIMPVDIPLVRPFTIHRMLETAIKQPGKIIYPAFHGKRGHPPLIPTKLAPVILEWGKEGNLKEVLESQESIAEEVSVPDENIVFDIDNPIAYEELLIRIQRYEFPTEKECEIILKDIVNVSPELLAHSYKVAEVATAIAHSLLTAGAKLNLEAVQSAAVLHDIAKGQDNHAAAGARLLQEMGFGIVGDIVASHAVLPPDWLYLPLENKVVYLADKYVAGDKVTLLEERFSAVMRRFGNDPNAEINIRMRHEKAIAVNKEIESIIDHEIWWELH
ncbi:DVU_1551 family NTP transferase [Chloroflexota bacterium]